VVIERGYKFIGESKIVNAVERTKESASIRREEIIYVEVGLTFARREHIVFIPGEVEIDFVNGHRPELYGDITHPDAYQSPECSSL